MTDKHETQITQRTHKRSIALERSVRILLEGLNMFDGSNFTIISDVVQEIDVWFFVDVSSPSYTNRNIVTLPKMTSTLIYSKIQSAEPIGR